MGWGPVDWVGRVLPEPKFEKKCTSFFEIFGFERPLLRYLLKTVLHCKDSGIWLNAITQVRDSFYAFSFFPLFFVRTITIAVVNFWKVSSSARRLAGVKMLWSSWDIVCLQIQFSQSFIRLSQAVVGGGCTTPTTCPNVHKTTSNIKSSKWCICNPNVPAEYIGWTDRNG